MQAGRAHRPLRAAEAAIFGATYCLAGRHRLARRPASPRAAGRARRGCSRRSTRPSSGSPTTSWSGGASPISARGRTKAARAATWTSASSASSMSSASPGSPSWDLTDELSSATGSAPSARFTKCSPTTRRCATPLAAGPARTRASRSAGDRGLWFYQQLRDLLVNYATRRVRRLRRRGSLHGDGVTLGTVQAPRGWSGRSSSFRRSPRRGSRRAGPGGSATGCCRDDVRRRPVRRRRRRGAPALLRRASLARATGCRSRSHARVTKQSRAASPYIDEVPIASSHAARSRTRPSRRSDRDA